MRSGPCDPALRPPPRLDLESNQDRETLRRLVEEVDFFIESYDAGYLPERGLGYDELAAITPSLVYVSITPFGQDGQKAYHL